MSYFRVFFWERSSFIFRLRCQIRFSGKRIMIYPDNTRKIIFPGNFFGKTIFSGRVEKKCGFPCNDSVRDCISSGITKSLFSTSLLYRLFLLVYRSFLLKWFSSTFKKSTKCYSLDANKVMKRSAFFYFAKLKKFRCFKCFPKNLKSFCQTEGSDIGCLSLIKRLLSIFF